MTRLYRQFSVLCVIVVLLCALGCSVFRNGKTEGELAVRQAQAEAVRDPKSLGVVSIDGIVLPPGARMHVVTVMVDEGRPWGEAVIAAGPDTRANSYIHKVGDQCPPTVGATPKMRTIYFINFGKDTMGDDNIAWGKTQKLHPETPRAVFAVAEHNPNLDETLGMEGCMEVVSLKECSFGGGRRASRAWWNDTECGASLDDFGSMCRGSYSWFAFSREE